MEAYKSAYQTYVEATHDERIAREVYRAAPSNRGNRHWLDAERGLNKALRCCNDAMVRMEDVR